MIYKKLLLLLMFSIVLKTQAQTVDAKPAGYRKYLDVAYSPDDKENVMDVYFPENYVNAKVIVYLHGSAWSGGDKKELPEVLISELAGKRKYIVVSANYRLIRDGKNRFPAQMIDIGKLFAFLSEKADQYHFNGKEFALMGGSAGGHLAMLYAYGYDTAKQVKTVVDFWGPTDFADPVVQEDEAAKAKVINLLGESNPKAQIYRDASPYYRLTKATGVPTIIFHGGQDPLVPASQADKLYKKLQSLNIPSQYEFYPNEKHGMQGAAGVDVITKTLAWLATYFPAS